MKITTFFKLTIVVGIAALMCACTPKKGEEKAFDDITKQATLPMSLLDGFSITEFSQSDTTLVAHCSVTDQYMAGLFKEDADYMLVNLFYATKGDSFKAIRDALIDNGVGITFVAKDASGNDVNTVTISAKQLAGDIDKSVVVRATAKAENSQCPMDMDDGRKLISATAQGDDTVVYIMECGENYRTTDFASIEEAMKRAMINSMADAAGKRERNAMGIYYKYVYVIGADTLHTITITPHDWLLY